MMIAQGEIAMTALSAVFEGLVFDAENASSTGGKQGPVVITFIGSGGKTSLIWMLARNLAKSARETAVQRKILVTPTTKMFPPQPNNCCDHYYTEIPAKAAPGITLAGIYNKKTGKLESFAMPELERLAAFYDLVLIEGDGSRELPLKGWTDYEPVVPSWTDWTVGIVPLWLLGTPISDKIIHRLPQFCALCGAQPGAPLTTAHLAQVISGNAKNPAQRSLFSAAQGNRMLFLNQSGINELAQSKEIIGLLPDECRLNLRRIISGNTQQDAVYGFTP